MIELAASEEIALMFIHAAIATEVVVYARYPRTLEWQARARPRETGEHEQ
jgi:hypothetical protein